MGFCDNSEFKLLVTLASCVDPPHERGDPPATRLVQSHTLLLLQQVQEMLFVVVPEGCYISASVTDGEHLRIPISRD